MPPAVDDKRPQQPQQQQPKLSATIDPHEDPVAFLRANGFKPLGNPEWPSCLWVDSTRPMFPTEHKEPKVGPFLVPDAKTKSRVEMKQYTQRMADHAGNTREVPVEQIVYTPAQEPVSLQQALLMVMEREHKKRIDAERAAAKKREAEQAAA